MHVPGDPLTLVNIWDAGSAKAVAAAGATALATGSYPMADMFGVDDGENMPMPEMLYFLAQIVGATDLPVSHDVERGYGAMPGNVECTCNAVVAAGAIGVNMEDSLPDGSLRDLDGQSARYAAARSGMDTACTGTWLNARTDIFAAMGAAEVEAKIEAVAQRSEAYKDAGADSLFVPFLRDLEIIEKVCASSVLPVNIMRIVGGPSIADYAAKGVARISHGPTPRKALMDALKTLAKSLYGG
ncbi:MAG: isocitrate lyase/phosphoenolpyruvate mutase family protein [Pseudomonadota bacterium]